VKARPIWRDGAELPGRVHFITFRFFGGISFLSSATQRHDTDCKHTYPPKNQVKKEKIDS
jgi:hypothetical protein